MFDQPVLPENEIKIYITDGKRRIIDLNGADTSFHEFQKINIFERRIEFIIGINPIEFIIDDDFSHNIIKIPLFKTLSLN